MALFIPASDAKVVTNLVKKPSAENVRRETPRLDHDIRQVENDERQAENAPAPSSMAGEYEASSSKPRGA
jgi:hypothetical protein